MTLAPEQGQALRKRCTLVVAGFDTPDAAGEFRQLADWCERHTHLAHHEEQAFAALVQLHGVPVGDRLRPMSAAELEAIAQPLACAIGELPIRAASCCTWTARGCGKAPRSTRRVAARRLIGAVRGNGFSRRHGFARAFEDCSLRAGPDAGRARGDAAARGVLDIAASARHGHRVRPGCRSAVFDQR